MVPEKKITPEDVKYALSSHYQGTPYDPYDSRGNQTTKGISAPSASTGTTLWQLIQMRPDVPEEFRAVEWLAFASNALMRLAPFYANVSTTPVYLSNTTKEVSTDNFYWSSRMIAAMADASYGKSVFHIERYKSAVQSSGHELIGRYDEKQRQEADAARRAALREQANQEIADTLKKQTADTLDKVLFELSSQMKNAYSRSDA